MPRLKLVIGLLLCGWLLLEAVDFAFTLVLNGVVIR